jgi:hypothetical protein
MDNSDCVQYSIRFGPLIRHVKFNFAPILPESDEFVASEMDCNSVNLESEATNQSNLRPWYFRNADWEIQIDNHRTTVSWRHHDILPSAQEIERLRARLGIVWCTLAGGFVFHASSIIHHNQAYLFSGHSGVGKTTLAQLLKGEQVLTNDQVIVLPHSSDWSASCYLPRLTSKYMFSINRIFFLEQAKKSSALRLEQTLGFAKVMESIFFEPDFHGSLKHLILANADHFSSSIPTYQLQVSLEDIDIELLEKAS